MNTALRKAKWEGLQAVFNDDAFHLFMASKPDTDEGWSAHRALVSALTAKDPDSQEGRGFIMTDGKIAVLERKENPNPDELYDFIDSLLSKVSLFTIRCASMIELVTWQQEDIEKLEQQIFELGHTAGEA